MCGCLKHEDPTQRCECICPEHGNFDKAYDLAMSRYDQITRLQRRLAELEMDNRRLRQELERHTAVEVMAK